MQQHITNFTVKEVRDWGDSRHPSGLETSAIGMESP